MANKKQEIVKLAESVQMPLHFNMPVGMPSRYATNVLLQAGSDEVIISFFEAQPPLVMTDDPQAIEMLKKTGIRADCVSKIVVPKSKFLGFSQAIAEMAEIIIQEIQNK